VRSNKARPRPASMACTRRVTALCVSPATSAAFVKLRCCATRWKRWSS
jgi:hypothetical protein